VNAIYLKAPWTDPFWPQLTQPGPFHLAGGETVNVPMMNARRKLSCARASGFSMVAIPYADGDLQFLILLPDTADGLAAMEKKLSTGLLASAASLQSQDVVLTLPKFKLEPPVFRLGAELQRLGMKSAFDVPQGSANFDRIAPRRPEDYLFISEVFHKAFLSLDEKGTEASAATAVAVAAGAASRPKTPVEVKVDRPFLFAIQHRPSGACLFLGHVADPR
jgi:serpin B